MPLVAGAKLPTAPLLFAMLIELWSPQYRDLLALVGQGEGGSSFQPFLIGSVHGQHDRNRLVSHALVQQTAKVLTLQKFPLSHEACQRRGPAFRQDLHPLRVQLERGRK